MPSKLELHNQEKPFIFLLQDAKVFLGLAKPLYELRKSHDPEQGEFDRNVWHQEKSFSRACFIMSIAGLEAFCNSIYEYYGSWTNEKFPEEFLKKSYRPKGMKRKILKKSSLPWWPLFEKVLFLVSMCSPEVVNPTRIFDPECNEMLLLLEYIEIRNSLVHGKIIKRRLEVTTQSVAGDDGQATSYIEDDFPQNFWPISKVPKFAMGLDYEHASANRELVMFLITQLMSKLSGIVPQDFLTNTDGVVYENGRKFPGFKTSHFWDGK